MKKKLIITINLNTMDLSKDRLTKEWIDHRINLFMKYTCYCLINQTCQDFLALIHYDIKSHGLVFDALSKYTQLPDNIIFRPTDKIVAYEQICEDSIIEKSIVGYDYLYLIPFDSDNLMDSEYMQRLMDFNHQPDTECIINKKAYVYDMIQDIMLSYTTPDGCCALYSLVYRVDKYIDGYRYKYHKHNGAFNLKHEYILQESILVLIHGTNHASCLMAYGWNPRTIDEVKNKVLKNFRLI